MLNHGRRNVGMFIGENQVGGDSILGRDDFVNILTMYDIFKLGHIVLSLSCSQ